MRPSRLAVAFNLLSESHSTVGAVFVRTSQSRGGAHSHGQIVG
jgi:hypothetical protein